MEYGILFEFIFDGSKSSSMWYKDNKGEIIRYPDVESAKNDIQKAITQLMTSVFNGEAVCHEGIRNYSYTFDVNGERINMHVEIPVILRSRAMSPAEYEQTWGRFAK